MRLLGSLLFLGTAATAAVVAAHGDFSALDTGLERRNEVRDIVYSIHSRKEADRHYLLLDLHPPPTQGNDNDEHQQDGDQDRAQLDDHPELPAPSFYCTSLRYAHIASSTFLFQPAARGAKAELGRIRRDQSGRSSTLGLATRAGRSRLLPHDLLLWV
ncbi:hypothetical protein V8E36_003595 [Tilletia maclaganii]